MAVDNDEIRWIDPAKVGMPSIIGDIKKILARRGYYRKAVVA